MATHWPLKPGRNPTGFDSQHRCMKPYLVIRNEQYYPSHGTGDWVDTFELKSEAEDKKKEILENAGPYNDVSVEIVDLRIWTG